MKVFLTGATGYIGHQLALKLADQNFEVNALVRNLDSDKIPKHKNIIPYKGDICKYETVQNAIKNCDYVFHTAAHTDLKCNKIDKFYLYEKHKVKEYWLVEPADNTVMIFTLGDNAEYGKPRFFSKDDKITTPILEGLEIDLKPVFA